MICSVCGVKPATQFPKTGAVCAGCAGRVIVKLVKKKWGK